MKGRGERCGVGVFDVTSSWRLIQAWYSTTPTFCVTGDYYGQGTVRRRELGEACRLLGIPADRLTLLDDKDLRVSASVYAQVCLLTACQAIQDKQSIYFKQCQALKSA